MIRQLVIATLASATLGTTAYAQCAYIPAKAVMSQPEYVLVFGGRVVDIQEISSSASRATFEVQRVWKGSVPSRIDLYFARHSEGPRFTKGEYAVASAVRLTADNRKTYGIPDTKTKTPVLYEAHGCVSGNDHKAFESELDKYPSHPPKR